MNLRLNLQLNRRQRWTPRQTIKILDCIPALYEAIWEAHEKELRYYLDYQEERRRNRKSRRPDEPKLPAPSTQQRHEDDLLF